MSKDWVDLRTKTDHKIAKEAPAVDPFRDWVRYETYLWGWVEEVLVEGLAPPGKCYSRVRVVDEQENLNLTEWGVVAKVEVRTGTVGALLVHPCSREWFLEDLVARSDLRRNFERRRQFVLWKCPKFASVVANAAFQGWQPGVLRQVYFGWR